MNPVDRLEAAIERLKDVRAESGYITNDDLIVTLYRTIDAQISVLWAEVDSIKLHFVAMTNAPGGLDLEPGPFHKQPEKAWAHIERQRRYVLALADAILGSGDD